MSKKKNSRKSADKYESDGSDQELNPKRQKRMYDNFNIVAMNRFKMHPI